MRKLPAERGGSRKLDPFLPEAGDPLKGAPMNNAQLNTNITTQAGTTNVANGILVGGGVSADRIVEQRRYHAPGKQLDMPKLSMLPCPSRSCSDQPDWQSEHEQKFRHEAAAAGIAGRALPAPIWASLVLLKALSS